jgi:hypothetical protein
MRTAREKRDPTPDQGGKVPFSNSSNTFKPMQHKTEGNPSNVVDYLSSIVKS